MKGPISNFLFRGMAAEFVVRDWLRPPERTLAETELRPGQTVLDYGCGPGSFTVAAAKAVGSTGTVYAADIHPLALAYVERRAAKKGLWNIRTIRTDCATRLADASVDVALIYDALHDFARPDDVLREVCRVLKPGGTLSFADFTLSRAKTLARLTGDGLFRLVRQGKRTYTLAPVA